MSELSPQDNALLKEALERQARDWFEEASELAIATRVVFREMQRPQFSLTPTQLAQRKQILGIAHAVLESSFTRALAEAIGTLRHKEAIGVSAPPSGDVGSGSSQGSEGQVP